jgi:hypothetical protein
MSRRKKLNHLDSKYRLSPRDENAFRQRLRHEARAAEKAKEERECMIFRAFQRSVDPAVQTADLRGNR